LIAADAHSDPDWDRMRELLVDLGLYYRNTHGAIRRRLVQQPVGTVAEEPLKLRRPNLPLVNGAAAKPAPTDWDTPTPR